jgi:hypothetical protein
MYLVLSFTKVAYLSQPLGYRDMQSCRKSHYVHLEKLLPGAFTGMFLNDLFFMTLTVDCDMAFGSLNAFFAILISSLSIMFCGLVEY